MEYAVLTPVFEDGEDEPEELSLTALFLAHFCTPSERCRILTSFAGDDSQKVNLLAKRAAKIPGLFEGIHL
eukprot:400297-Pelagomonas_calceolata.AAC.1